MRSQFSVAATQMLADLNRAYESFKATPWNEPEEIKTKAICRASQNQLKPAIERFVCGKLEEPEELVIYFIYYLCKYKQIDKMGVTSLSGLESCHVMQARGYYVKVMSLFYHNYTLELLDCSKTSLTVSEQRIMARTTSIKEHFTRVYELPDPKLSVIDYLYAKLDIMLQKIFITQNQRALFLDSLLAIDGLAKDLKMIFINMKIKFACPISTTDIVTNISLVATGLIAKIDALQAAAIKQEQETACIDDEGAAMRAVYGLFPLNAKIIAEKRSQEQLMATSSASAADLAYVPMPDCGISQPFKRAKSLKDDESFDLILASGEDEQVQVPTLAESTAILPPVKLSPSSFSELILSKRAEAQTSEADLLTL